MEFIARRWLLSLDVILALVDWAAGADFDNLSQSSLTNVDSSSYVTLLHIAEATST